MASLTAIATPTTVSLHKGFSFTTSSSRNFCSFTTNSIPISSPLSFHQSSSGLRGKVKLLSLTTKMDRTNKTNALTEVMEAVKAVDSDTITNKTDAFTEALKAVKAVDSDTSTFLENEIVRTSVVSTRPKQSRRERNIKCLNSSAAQRNTLDYYQILKYPLRSESAIQNIANNNTLVFVVDKRADKKNIREAAEKMFKIQTRKVNTSIMPDGTKKAYLMLRPEYNASDIAKKIKVF